VVGFITNSLVPSKDTVSDPVPESAMVAEELPSEIAVDDIAPIDVSTYALIDCCVARLVAESDAMLSSSNTTPLVKSAKSMFEIELPVPLASNVLLVNVKVSEATLAVSASTYALIDCCVASAVFESLAMLSSSNTLFNCVLEDPIMSPFLTLNGVAVIGSLSPFDCYCRYLVGILNL
jgi:hypothetical protein